MSHPSPATEPNDAVEPPLLVQRTDGVVTLTFNRPKRKNAIDDVLWGLLDQELRNIAREPDDRVVVLQGAAGDFCSGADVTGLGEQHEHGLDRMRRTSEVVIRLARLARPTIAKVHGVAVGIGMNLALACDFVVATHDARFSEIFRHRGLSLDGGGSWSLPRLVGLRRAKELALLGDFVSGAAAAEIGLINRSTTADEIDAVVAAWTSALVSGPPIALAQTKELLNNSFDVTLEQALDDEGRAQTVNFATDDAAEAVAAFLEKRQPEFRGR
jgi:2-(1,2-epoxy-1,2-dihydrophenyl)acetyl-CoA isomerase